jgi:hypothetical protein
MVNVEVFVSFVAVSGADLIPDASRYFWGFILVSWAAFGQHVLLGVRSSWKISWSEVDLNQCSLFLPHRDREEKTNPLP